MKKVFAVLALTAGMSVSALAADVSGFIMDKKCSANVKMVGNEACAKKCLGGGDAAVLATDDGKVLAIVNQDKVKDHWGHKVTVTGKVVEVTPNVTGQIVAIPVKTNVPVKSGDVLFQIDPAPFQYKVAQLKASLAGAKQQAEILKSNYQQAAATAAGLAAQLKFNTQRLADIKTLATEGANT